MWQILLGLALSKQEGSLKAAVTGDCSSVDLGQMDVSGALVRLYFGHLALSIGL